VREVPQWLVIEWHGAGYVRHEDLTEGVRPRMRVFNECEPQDHHTRGRATILSTWATRRNQATALWRSTEIGSDYSTRDGSKVTEFGCRGEDTHKVLASVRSIAAIKFTEPFCTVTDSEIKDGADPIVRKGALPRSPVSSQKAGTDTCTKTSTKATLYQFIHAEAVRFTRGRRK